MKDIHKHFEQFRALYSKTFDLDLTDIHSLPLSGSDRKYFRLTDEKGKTSIGTFSTDRNETNSFLYFSRVFKKHQLAVPEIYVTSGDKKYYIQEDVGAVSLLEILQQEGYTERVKNLYKKAIDGLVRFHWQASKEIDYTLCHGSSQFDRNAIFSDVLYFKYYFADLLKVEYDKNLLLEEFNDASKNLASQKPQAFMYRDFQSRNILVRDEEVHFIDFQGGMQGLPQYDIASLLWQAKAQLPDEWKNDLLNYYFEALKLLPERPNFDETTFRRVYLDCVLLRIMQTLGAYGFRGLYEKKPHFLSSIYPALLQLKSFLNTWPHLPSSNEHRKLLLQLIRPEIIARFEPRQLDTENVRKLQVDIYSFSYKKGLPAANVHGGGFVFDCRGILNPGREASYKAQTGKDMSVQTYLETRTDMPKFLEGVFSVVDISVEDYIIRGFDNLQISFGCTGGQHRSVYAAEQTKKHLESKYGVQVNIIHLEQDANDLTRR